MSLGDRFPVDPLSDADWEEVERAVYAELDAEPGAAQAPRRSRWLRVAGGAVVVAAAAALALVVVLGRGGPAPLRRSRLEAGAEPTRAVVGDVSLRLSARTELVVIDHPESGSIVTLERGEVAFSVPPRAGRPPFVVQAADVSVEVVGTRFSVSRDGEQVAVAVERGVVRVTRDGRTTRLEPGARWSTAEVPDVRGAGPSKRAPEPQVETPRAASAPGHERRARSRRDPVAPEERPRVLFERAASLERRDSARAIALYARIASGGGPWAPAALFAQARLELERGRRAEARRLSRRYLERYPRGLNADDARRLLTLP